jgi:membrane protein
VTGGTHQGETEEDGVLARLRRLLDVDLWSREPLPRPLSWLRSTAQLGLLIVEGFGKDQLVLRAQSLTYLTVLSLVPFLALIVSFAAVLDVDKRVLQILVSYVSAAVPEAGQYLMRWTQDLEFGALGPIMGGVLIATTVLAVGGIEQALNAIWGITKQRPWLRRIPDYLAVLVIAPLLLGVAIPLRASLESQWIVQRLLDVPGVSALYQFGLKQTPLLLVTAAFSFMYWFLPNTEVRVRSALLGGVVGGALFGAAQTAYVKLNVGAAKYSAIFGGFAALPLFIVWVFFSWAIFLLGAEVAYAYQTLARYRREVRGAAAGPAARELIGMAIVLECARAFDRGDPPWTVEGLSETLDVPLRTVRDVTERLAESGILAPSGGPTPDVFQMGRPAERVRVADVLRTLRGARDVVLGEPRLAAEARRTLEDVDAAAARVAEQRTLRDLIRELEAGGRADEEPEPARAGRAAVEARTASS